MTRSARVRLTWVGRKCDFALPIEQLDELEVLSNPDEPAHRVGPGYMLGQFMAGLFANWKPRWIVAIIRLGLIGGGMPAARAEQLVNRYVQGDLSVHIPTCIAILSAAITGGDDEPGEQMGSATKAAPSPMDDFPSSSSTAGPASSAIPSDGFRSGSSPKPSKDISKRMDRQKAKG